MTTTQRLKEKLADGELWCLCHRKATKIVNGAGVCAVCLKLESRGNGHSETKPESPNAKYADWGFTPDYGHMAVAHFT